MLDLLRKQASSWMIKAILAVICVVFIFFFGSETLRGPAQGGSVLATVDGEPILARDVENRLRQQRDNNPLYKNLPEDFMGQLRNMILNAMIQEKILLKEATEMGLRVSDAELAQAIKNRDDFKDGENFDTNRYHQVREFFYRRYNIDLETSLRNEKLQNKIRDSFNNAVLVSEDSLKIEYLLNNTQVQFEQIILDQNKLAQSIKITDDEKQAWLAENKEEKDTNDEAVIKSEEEAKKEQEAELQRAERALKAQKAEELYSKLKEELWAKYRLGQNLKSEIKKYNLEKKETPLVSISQYNTLIPGLEDLTQMTSLFSLNKENPYPSKAISQGNRTYFLKLLDKKQAKLENFDPQSESEKVKSKKVATLFDWWYKELEKNHKIEYSNEAQ